MNLKRYLQKLLVRWSGLRFFSLHVARNQLDDTLISELIHDGKDDYVLAYGQHHSLSADHITQILSRGKLDNLTLSVVRQYDLTPEQQMLVISIKNVFLLETYLCPDGFFAAKRRFAPAPEYQFLSDIITGNDFSFVEIFKTYVDNTYQTLLTAEITRLMVENGNAYATQYMLQRIRFNKDLEVLFEEIASDDLIKCYLNFHEFGTDKAQIALVENRFNLAQYHFEKYKLRPNVQRLYHEKRQQRLTKNKN